MKKLIFATVFSIMPIISMQNLILISAPGSGKGTLSQYLIKTMGIHKFVPATFSGMKLDEKLY